MGQFYLSDRDRAKIAESVKRTTTQPLPVPMRHTVPPDPVGARPPELYIAKLPDSGIAKRIDDTAGHGTCDIYSLLCLGAFDTLEFDLNQALVGESDGLQVEVYNFYLRPWFGFSKYIVVYRDKFGRWLCSPPPTEYQATLDANLVQGSTATASIFYRDTDLDQWVDSGQDLTAHEFVLNTDEMFVQYQKGTVTWDEGGVWVYSSPVCPVADDTGLVP